MGLNQRVLAASVATLIAITGLAGCEPRVRLGLTVTATGVGADADPGDGVCASTLAGGACTLQAAIEEGNLAPDGADVTLPAGLYRATATVTGDVRINPGAPVPAAILGSTLTVADGGGLEMTGINTSTTQGDLSQLALVVQAGGEARIARSILNTVSVEAGGRAALSATIVLDLNAPGLSNAGGVVAVASSIQTNTLDGATVAPVATSPGGRSHLQASLVARPEARLLGSLFSAGGGGGCSGPAPTSGGYVLTEVSCGSIAQPGDVIADSLSFFDADLDLFDSSVRGITFGLDAASPAVDAIPLGDPACDTAAVDVYGTARGIDGNGDGVGGCDIGAVERQP